MKPIARGSVSYVVMASIAFNPWQPITSTVEDSLSDFSQKDVIYSTPFVNGEYELAKTISEWGETEMRLQFSNSYDALLMPLIKLEQNWDSFGAEPPNASALRVSDNLLSLLRVSGLKVDGVVPSPEGGVGIVFYNGQRYADIEVFNHGTILAGIDDKINRPEVWEISNDQDDFKIAIGKISEFLNA